MLSFVSCFDHVPCHSNGKVIKAVIIMAQESTLMVIGHCEDIIWQMVCTVGHCNGSVGYYDDTNWVVLCHQKILWCHNCALV